MDRKNGDSVENNAQALPFERAFKATPEEIRETLRQVRATLRQSGIERGLAARTEQVLAEALNNVEEHAYAGGGARPVRLSIQQQSDELCADIRDNGAAMPHGNVPNGTLPSADVPQQDLPEGGFGWYLIHQLSDSLIYERGKGENRLRLRFAPRKEG